MLKQVLLIALGIIAFFFTFIFIANQFQPLPITDQLYVHPGSCKEMKWKNCLDTKDFEFSKIQERINKQQTMEEINKWLKEKNKIQIPFKIELDQNNEFVALANEEIQTMKKLCSFQLNDMFHRDALGPAYFSKSYPGDKLTLDIQSFLKLVLPKQFQKLMIILLYHIYNYEYSKYKPWIQTFPEKVNSLISNLTYYEMQLLNDDQSYGFIENYVDIAKREFKTLELEIKRKLNKDQIASFFNNKSFTISDYIFARNIVQLTGQGSDSAIHEVLLNPCNLYIGKKVLDSEIPIETQQQNFDSDNQAIFDKLADREFHSGNQIVENFHYPYAYSAFVLHAQVAKESKTDCVEIQLYENAELAKDLKYSYPKNTLLNFIAKNGFACIGNNDIGISRVTFLGKVMNMLENEIKECYKSFKEAEQRADQQLKLLESY